MIFPIL